MPAPSGGSNSVTRRSPRPPWRGWRNSPSDLSVLPRNRVSRLGAWTSHECRQCGSTGRITRQQDTRPVRVDSRGHRPYGLRTVRRVADREGSPAEGTPDSVRVRRPQLIGVPALSPSQRTAHSPAYRPPRRECCFREISIPGTPAGNHAVHGPDDVIHCHDVEVTLESSGMERQSR